MNAGARRLSSIVYGPVRSRRFGFSLGINLSGASKACTFDCAYCFRGLNSGLEAGAPAARLPSAAKVLEGIEAWLESSPSAQAVEDWTLAGNAEPTSHPEFAAIVEGAVRLRDRAFPKAKITVLTNGMGLLPRLRRDHAGVRRALERVDRPCLKLDAGTEPLFQRLSRPAARATLAEWTQAAQNLRPLMLQTLFVGGAIDNTEARELEALFARYRELAPRAIYLLTLNKPPAMAGVVPISSERVATIGAALEAVDFSPLPRPEVFVAA
jgi:wyosine [tRNA(Phe)-imidazoG37] synthetase (radical SAM superfamily)